MKIVPLVERPELVDGVAARGVAEWGISILAKRCNRRRPDIRESMSVGRVPIALVPLDDADAIVGTASLLFDAIEARHDLPDRAHLARS